MLENYSRSYKISRDSSGARNWQPQQAEGGVIKTWVSVWKGYMRKRLLPGIKYNYPDLTWTLSKWLQPCSNINHSNTRGAVQVVNEQSVDGNMVEMGNDRKVTCILCERSEETKISGALSTKDQITAHQNCLVNILTISFHYYYFNIKLDILFSCSGVW